MELLVKDVISFIFRYVWNRQAQAYHKHYQFYDGTLYKIEPETDPNIPITRSTVKRRRLSSETPSGKLLNDSIASNNTDSTSNISHQSASNKSEDDLELKEEVNDDDLDDDNNLYVDESVDTDTDTELLLANGDRQI